MNLYNKQGWFLKKPALLINYFITLFSSTSFINRTGELDKRLLLLELILVPVQLVIHLVEKAIKRKHLRCPSFFDAAKVRRFFQFPNDFPDFFISLFLFFYYITTRLAHNPLAHSPVASIAQKITTRLLHNYYTKTSFFRVDGVDEMSILSDTPSIFAKCPSNLPEGLSIFIESASICADALFLWAAELFPYVTDLFHYATDLFPWAVELSLNSTDLFPNVTLV